MQTDEFAQLQLQFVDQIQWRYEVIRPVVLFADRTARQRAQETHTHSDTVRTLQQRFRQRGMPGLLPAGIEVVHRRRASPIPDAVRPEIDRLRALYDGFHYRELARILFILSVPGGFDEKVVSASCNVGKLFAVGVRDPRARFRGRRVRRGPAHCELPGRQRHGWHPSTRDRPDSN